MIWNDTISSTDPGLDTLTEHIAAEVRSVGPDFTDWIAPHESGALARSVAEFMFHADAFIPRPREARRAANGVMIPSDYLLLMTCRALWAIGREEAARTLLRLKGPELNITESYGDAVFGGDLFPRLGHAVRALRPSPPFWSAGGPCWTLNLRTVFSFPGAGLELTIWRVLHALLGQLSGLWDSAGGRGTLGLKNTRFIAVKILGHPGQSRHGRRFAAETLRYCQESLRTAAEKKEWHFTPAVMDFDV
ncbi:MAG: hypothetical protein PHP98_11005 [Kiritimatiellae bacterium]|nr:hypothetical protein [Kiritimatiellia bacterium]